MPMFNRHPGEGRDPHRAAGASIWAWIPAFAGMTMFAVASTASAQTATDQLMGSISKALSKNKSEQMGQGIAVATLLGCTGKTAGRQQTDAYYQRIQTVGKEVESYCKAKQPDQARALVLQTLKTDQHNPVVLAANDCYSTSKANYDVLAGPKLANDTEHYARWIRDPALAESEMRNEDICK